VLEGTAATRTVLPVSRWLVNGVRRLGMPRMRPPPAMAGAAHGIVPVAAPGICFAHWFIEGACSRPVAAPPIE
jgi:hypothetical protein